MENKKSNRIKVILLSSIAENLGWNEKYFTIKNTETKAYSIWNLINSKYPKENIIVAINQELTDMNATINPDDEVAFMPIFTGG